MPKSLIEIHNGAGYSALVRIKNSQGDTVYTYSDSSIIGGSTLDLGQLLSYNFDSFNPWTVEVVVLGSGGDAGSLPTDFGGHNKVLRFNGDVSAYIQLTGTVCDPKSRQRNFTGPTNPYR